MVTIIVPANNEERVIPRLLGRLTGEDLEAEIIVVANGCTDRTAAVAGAFPGVQVIETPVPSKISALALGDQQATSFPRLYVDADVQLGAEDVRALCSALEADGVCAAGPTRLLPMEGVAWSVRAYYGVWQQLDGVRRELYGRGVIAVDAVGHARVADWPEVMSDDLLLAMRFAPHESTVVAKATVVIRPPRTYRDLLRRRVRAMTGNQRLRTVVGALQVRGSGASLTALLSLAVRRPSLAPGVVVFGWTAVLARMGAARALARRDTVWLRDESSRTA